MSELSLLLSSPDELFEGPPPGRDTSVRTSSSYWDNVGATLGEAGVTRLLRQLQAHGGAAKIVLRIAGGSDGIEPCLQPDADAIIRRLHAWCRARIASNRESIRICRRLGGRVLGLCVCVLGVLLALAWALQQESFLGPPGAARMLASEALVIAGWVVMWRPIELLVFDPMRAVFESRLLARALNMEIRVERVAQPTDSPLTQGSAVDGSAIPRVG